MRLALTRTLVVFTVIASVRYFGWRVTATENPSAMWFFYLFLFVEGLNFIEAALFYVTTWKPTHYTAPPPLPGRTVDVFITTYDEPVELLRETVVCALSMRYPHQTWVLDDGRRKEVRELAEELGCHYLAREDNRHAKAGNLNHALERTSGEFIVTLDADHVPSPELIDELIGFFRDPRVAIVQAAQDFYNLDSFQHQTDPRAGYGWQQQELFFSVIQPGKDGFGAAFYCGSPAMLRRKALEEIGGFATGTITEDMHTGLRLQQRGWRVLYFNRTVARGLAPQTFVGFATQWQRWGYGAMQVLWRENVLLGRGLSLGQRLCYFASFYFYWMSYQKLLFVLTPIFCLLTGIFPLRAEPAQFALYFTPYFALNFATSAVLQGGVRGFLLSEQFNVLKMHVLMRTVLGLRRRNGQFKVTPKAQAAAAGWADLWPQLLLLGAMALAAARGIWYLPQAGAGFEFWAFVVNLLWVAFYVLLLLPAVLAALRRREQRAAYRFPDRLDALVRLRFTGAGETVTVEERFARNLNRTGLSVTREGPIPVGMLVELEIQLPGRVVRATGRVVRHHRLGDGKRPLVANGIRFERIEARDQDEISKYLYWQVAPRHAAIMRLTQSTQKAHSG